MVVLQLSLFNFNSRQDVCDGISCLTYRRAIRDLLHLAPPIIERKPRIFRGLAAASSRNRFQASSLLNHHDRTVEYRGYPIVTGRILLIEADVVLGAVLAEVLRHSGYEVIVVNTLIKGKIDRIHSVSSVILDIDTTTAEKELAWLDALRPYDESLSIVLMGLQISQELHNRLCLQLGLQQPHALTLVQKPFRNDELLAAVREAQESRLPDQIHGV